MELRESGQIQMRRDSIYYLLDGLSKKEDMDVRISSAVSLANMVASCSDFGTFLRAHGMIEVVFQALLECNKQENTVCIPIEFEI